jgi:hypothetical protein
MRRTLVIGGLLAALTAGPASAQATIGWDAAVFSSYVWRGLTYTNKPVLEPDLYLTVPIGKASFTAGGWANIDIGKYSDANNDISESGGTSSFNLAEFDWWGEVGVPVGGATLTAGATGYLFPNPASGCPATAFVCYTKAANTVEVYGKVALPVPELNPKINAYYDVDKVKGLYVEGSVSHGFPLGASSLTLGGLVGYNNGQQAKGSTDPSFNFAENGITHVDVFANTSFAAGPLSIAPSIHGIFGVDKGTKYTKPSNAAADNTKFKVWGGVTISWSHALGAKPEATKE